MCYLAERGHSALKGAGINREEPPKLEIFDTLLPWNWSRLCERLMLTSCLYMALYMQLRKQLDVTFSICTITEYCY